MLILSIIMTIVTTIMIIIIEENNNIKIKNLFLNDFNQIIKIDQANFNYLDTENKKNITVFFLSIQYESEFL